MAIEKPSQKVLNQLEDRKKSILQAIEKSKLLSQLKGNKLWEAVEAIVSAKLLYVESKLDQWELLSDNETKSFLTQRRDMKFFMEMPENYTEGLQYLNQQREDIENQIVEYRERLERVK